MWTTRVVVDLTPDERACLDAVAPKTCRTNRMRSRVSPIIGAAGDVA